MSRRPDLRLAAATVIAAAFAVAGGGASAQDVRAPASTALAGIDEAGIDRTVRPGDDFYLYANGSWQARARIPPGRVNYSEFARVGDLARERIRGLLEEERAKPVSRIGRTYAAFMGSARIERLGLKPAARVLGGIAAITTRAQLAAAYGQAWRNGIGTPFKLYVMPASPERDCYRLVVAQDGLGLPDREYYLAKTTLYETRRQHYRAYLAKLLAVTGVPDSERRAQGVLDFETEIARVTSPRAERRNPANREPLPAMGPGGFDMSALLAAAGVPQGIAPERERGGVAAIAKLLETVPLDVVRDQLTVRALEAYAGVLPAAVRTAHDGFIGETSGILAPDGRRRAIDLTVEAFPDETGRAFVTRYLAPATRARAAAIARSVKAALRARVEQAAWMVPATKARSLAKLDAVTIGVGYPDRWHDTTAVTISADDAFGNLQRAREWAASDRIAKLGEPVRRWEWGLTPMTTNAYADPQASVVVIPAALLEPPFFDPSATAAAQYGSLGNVVGRVLSSQIEESASFFGGDQPGRSWWTPADRNAFHAITGRLVAQTSAYEALPGLHAPPGLTVNEDISDLAGLEAALDAYHRTLADVPMASESKDDRGFFLAWAQLWRQVYGAEVLRQKVLVDSHSPGVQRAWLVRNLDAWYAAFGVQPDEKLYLARGERVKVW